MKDKKVEVAIVGAGTAGLSALREVRKVTENFVIINGGPYGTTCARVGCMPSKVLIQVASDYYRRQVLEKEGIYGGESLKVDDVKALSYVRSLRDRFVSGVTETTEALEDRRIDGFAQFVEPNVLRVNDTLVRAEKVILATGSTPIIPKDWAAFSDKILTSDEIFELERLPKSIAVVGLGVIGLELGQALNRLGVKTVGIGRSEFVGGLTDPKINAYAVDRLSKEFPLWLGQAANVQASEAGLLVSAGNQNMQVEKVLASLGRRPNLSSLKLESLGVALDERGMPPFNSNTMQIGDLPIFIAGDVNAERAILHEAADEGRIAGYNAVRQTPTCFQRKTKLAITFSDPNIATAGKSWKELDSETFVTGEVQFDGQGRSLVMSKNSGYLRVYGHRKTGELLGAEMIAPSGEHLAHLLSWAMQSKLTVMEVLRFAFYHPVVEEGLRTALRDLATKVERPAGPLELATCAESGVEVLC